MPATALTLTRVGHLTPVPLPAAVASDPTNGNSVPNGGSTLLILKNTDTASHTVMVSFSKKVQGQAVTPLTWTLAAGDEQIVKLGPVPDFGSSVFIDTDSNLVTVRALQA